MTLRTHARSFFGPLRAGMSGCAASIGFRAVVGCLAAIGVLVFAAPADANVSHAFAGSFAAPNSILPNPYPSNPYPLSDPADVAVDQANHDVYVADSGNHRIEKFNSDGDFLLMFGKRVDQTTGGDVCTEESGDTCQAGESTSAAGGFEQPTSLAIDEYPGGEGDVYVGDVGDGVVQKFDSSGHIISSWGTAGQKEGADATDLPIFGPVHGVAVGGGCATPEKPNFGACSANGTLYVDGGNYSDLYEYTPNGTYIKWAYIGVQSDLEADAAGDVFTAPNQVFENIPIKGEYQDQNQYQMTTEGATTGFGFDPVTRELYQDLGSSVDHYNGDCEPVANGPCSPADSFGSGVLSEGEGVAVDGSTHTVYVANSAKDEVAVFSDVRPVVTTEPATNVTETEVTLTGTIDPKGRGAITECRFEYGFGKSYGTVLPCSPNPETSHFTEATRVTATVTGLSSGSRDHYRVVATNEAGATSLGLDETFITTQPPAIDGLASANLTATTADIKAQVNPNGLETHYRLEYGPTISYGQTAPVPDGTLSAGNSDQAITIHLEGLTPNIVYHYQLVATNADGTRVSGDQTFDFYPPACPNENVRQQTQANYLPDCRAYELVSPENADGTQLSPDGPNTGYATNPPRFSYSGEFSTIAEAGGAPIDGDGDLYVATRTSTGWKSKYVGIPASQAAVDGGPPLGPPNSTPAPDFRSPSTMSSSAGRCPKCQDYVLTNPSMSTFADFNDGNQSVESIFTSDFHNRHVISSNAPYVWNAEGEAVDRWPTNLASVPPGRYPASSGEIYSHGGYPETGDTPLKIAPGGTHALDCPAVLEGGSLSANDCPGDVTASADLNHFVFASEWNAFAPGGQLGAPGSVYDNNTAADTVEIASKTPEGANIPSEPGDEAGDPLQIPAVSANGSHILMAAGGTGPCGEASCPITPCGADYSAVRRCQMQPSHLYMRIDGAITDDVSQGHDVTFVGMTADGSRVYFTSPEQLTSEDTDSSVDLYMWNESTNSITLVSKGNNGAGNGDSCNADFTSKCDVRIYSQQIMCESEDGGIGTIAGNCFSDNFIASESGDIYFFSPELLDGTRGIPNQQNLYVFREGQVQYVTTLSGPQYCYTTYSASECTRMERIQVSPNGDHMAFISNAEVTQYNSEDHMEMYTYEPSTKTIVCVSCIPSGEPPKSEVYASQDGLFMTNDGRTFFSTEDALVHADTNQGPDVYEYVEGRPQLITPGTGDTTAVNGGALGFGAKPGLVGVSADGTDVYFSSYQTLVPQDHNGLFLKFYDARAGGGFPAANPEPPCNAADEYHGATTAAPAATANGTDANLTGGNFQHGGKHRAANRHGARQRHAHRKGQARRHHRPASAAHRGRRTGR